MGGIGVDYSGVFSTHHILRLTLTPAKRIGMVNELVIWQGLDQALRSRAEEICDSQDPKEIKVEHNDLGHKVQARMDEIIDQANELLMEHLEADDTDALWHALSRCMKEDFIDILQVRPSEKSKLRKLKHRGKVRVKTVKVNTASRIPAHAKSAECKQFKAEAWRRTQQERRLKHCANRLKILAGRQNESARAHMDTLNREAADVIVANISDEPFEMDGLQ